MVIKLLNAIVEPTNSFLRELTPLSFNVILYYNAVCE